MPQKVLIAGGSCELTLKLLQPSTTPTMDLPMSCLHRHKRMTQHHRSQHPLQGSPQPASTMHGGQPAGSQTRATDLRGMSAQGRERQPGGLTHHP